MVLAGRLILSLNFISDHLSFFGGALLVLVILFAVLARSKKDIKAAKIRSLNIKKGMEEPTTLHPVIHAAKCGGCGACTKVCPEGDILSMINGKAVLIAPTKCIGHGACELACPFEAIDLVFGTKSKGIDIPRLSKDYETKVASLFWWKLFY